MTMAAQEQQSAERHALARRAQAGVNKQFQTMLHARIGRQLKAGDIWSAIINPRDIRGLDVHQPSHASHSSRSQDAQCRVASCHSIAKAAAWL
ncbi:hypothetical protein [Bradyrhizobium symbiodeficiens]|uniref:hypothetical protein n=1 Tax=Bradyrhizobium symbiodeficiens TaxID=1404367 RepID=UPI0018883F41